MRQRSVLGFTDWQFFLYSLYKIFTKHVIKEKIMPANTEKGYAMAKPTTYSNPHDPANDFKIGLLIECDAYVHCNPIYVIFSKENGPYGQRTEMGWETADNLDKSQYASCDTVAVSHMIRIEFQ